MIKLNRIEKKIEKKWKNLEKIGKNWKIRKNWIELEKSGKKWRIFFKKLKKWEEIDKNLKKVGNN